MGKRARVRAGDIIAIPLAEGMVGVGLVLHVSRVFPGGMLVGYFDQTFPSADAIRVGEVGGPFIDTPNYTGAVLVKEGDWPIVGHSEALLAKAEIPELRVVGDLYFKDEISRRIPREEWGQYAELVGQGGGYVEDKLRRHFTKAQ